MLAARPQLTAIQPGAALSDNSHSHSSTSESIPSLSRTSSSAHTSCTTHTHHLPKGAQQPRVHVQLDEPHSVPIPLDLSATVSTSKRKFRLLRKTPPSPVTTTPGNSDNNQNVPARRWSLFAQSRRTTSETFSDHRNASKRVTTDANKRNGHENDNGCAENLKDENGDENEDPSISRKHVPLGPPPSAFNLQHKARFSHSNSNTLPSNGRHRRKTLSDSGHGLRDFEPAKPISVIQRLRAQLSSESLHHPQHTSTPSDPTLAPDHLNKPLPAPPLPTPPLSSPPLATFQSEEDELAESEFGHFTSDAGHGPTPSVEGHSQYHHYGRGVAISDDGHGISSEFEGHWHNLGGSAYAASEPHFSGVSPPTAVSSFNGPRYPVSEIGHVSRAADGTFTYSATTNGGHTRKLSWTQRIKRSFSLNLRGKNDRKPLLDMGNGQEEGRLSTSSQPYTQSQPAYHYSSRIRHTSQPLYATSEPGHESSFSPSTPLLNPSQYAYTPHRLSPIAGSTKTIPPTHSSSPSPLPLPPSSSSKKLRKRPKHSSLTTAHTHIHSTSYPNLASFPAIISPRPSLDDHEGLHSVNGSVVELRSNPTTTTASSPDLLYSASQSPPRPQPPRRPSVLVKKRRTQSNSSRFSSFANGNGLPAVPPLPAGFEEFNSSLRIREENSLDAARWTVDTEDRNIREDGSTLPGVRCLSPLEMEFEGWKYTSLYPVRAQSSPELNDTTPLPSSSSSSPVLPMPHTRSEPVNSPSDPTKRKHQRRSVLSSLSPLSPISPRPAKAHTTSTDDGVPVYMRKEKKGGNEKQRRSLPLLSQDLDDDERSQKSSRSAGPLLSYSQPEPPPRSPPVPPPPSSFTSTNVNTSLHPSSRPSFLRSQSNRRWTLAVSETPEDELVEELDRLRSIGWGLGFQGELFRREERIVTDGENTIVGAESASGWGKEEMEEWLVARKALLVCREIVRTEKTYQEGLDKLQRGETLKAPSPLLLQYLPALISASETFVTHLASDPSAWGVSLAFINTLETLEGAFVAWSGVVGEFFNPHANEISRAGRSKTRLTKAPRFAKSAAASPARALSSTSGSTLVEGKGNNNSGNGNNGGNWRISMGLVSQLLASSTEASLVRRTRYHTGGNNSGSGREKVPSVHDLAIQPTQRVMRYVLLYKDLLSSTPISSPARAVVEQALEGATRLAQRCNRAQDNAAFLI